MNESKARRELKKLGYQLKKSRVRNTNLDNWGGYMIIEPNMNSVVAGERFDMSLEEVGAFITG
jgi:hypothetical protein